MVIMLENLIDRAIDEQRRPARLKTEGMFPAVDWFVELRPLWGTSFNQLDDLLTQMKQNNEAEIKP